MKTFSTSGTGSGQTLSPIESDKIPIYETEADLDTDLANLADGQIVAFPDEGASLSVPIDEVKSGDMHAVTSNAVAGMFSKNNIDNTKFSISTTNVTAQCAGILYLVISSNTTNSVVIYEDDNLILLDDRGSTSSIYHPFTLIVRKGHSYKYGGGSLHISNFIPFDIN